MSDSDRNQPTFPVGSRVEVLPRRGLNTPRKGVVRRTVFHHKDRCWNYYLTCGDRQVGKRYLALDLRLDL